MSKQLARTGSLGVQKDFPILARKIHGKRFVYLDNASTTQKPRVVLDAMTHYYETSNANVHRGIYQVAEEAPEALDNAPRTVGKFLAKC